MTLLQFFRWLRRVLVIATLQGTLWLAIAPVTAISAPFPRPINQARQVPDGTEVMVIGRVTVPSGRFASASFEQGFALQDASGGIYITTDQKTALQEGEPVRVQGVVSGDGHGQRVIRLESWQLHTDPLARIMPKPVAVDTAITQLKGSLVTVQGRISRGLVTDAPFGDRLWLTDDTGTVQIYMPRSAQLHPEREPHLIPGQTLQVTGFSSQYDLSPEIIPRSLADIHLVNSRP